MSPRVQALANGWFASSVALDPEPGRGLPGRVLRLTRLFRCALEAGAHARAEARRWIAAPGACVPA